MKFKYLKTITEEEKEGKYYKFDGRELSDFLKQFNKTDTVGSIII